MASTEGASEKSQPNLNLNEFSKLSEEFYNRKKEELAEHKGKYVALDYQSEKFWIGETSSEALDKAKKAFPSRLFYLVQVGSRAPFSIQTLSRRSFFTGNSYDLNRSHR